MQRLTLRRFGVPLTEEQRRVRHSARYHTTTLPPRGTGLTKSNPGPQAWRRKMMYRRSTLTGKMTVYTKCQAISACDFFEYPLDQLRDAYNEEFLSQGVDAYVESCKQLRGTFQDNLIVDCWVASEGPIPVAVVALIIFLIKVVAVTIGGILILSAASAFIETIFPRPKFYAPDGTMFNDLASYLTYMRDIYNPSQAMPYTCLCCGQGFATEAERDEHQLNCPWCDGPPSVNGIPWNTILGIMLVVGGIYIASKIL